MRNKSFEMLLKEAILLAAEEQGKRLDSEPSAPVPAGAQARFDTAADRKERKTPERTAPVSFVPQNEEPRKKPVRRWFTYAVTAAVFTLVVLSAALLIKIRGTETKPGASMLPEITAELPSTVDPTPVVQTTPLPYTGITYQDKAEAETAMRQLFQVDRELIEQVKEDLNEPEHRVLKNGVVYADLGRNEIDWDHPCSETTEAIQRLLQLPGGGYFFAGWERVYRVPIFFLTVRWVNESGYYQTSLVYAEDPDYLYSHYPSSEDITPEPVTEDRTWAIYSECWQKAPFEMEPDPEPTPAPKPYITMFVNPGPDAVFECDAVVPASEMQARAKAFLERNRERLENAANDGIETLQRIIQNSDEPGVKTFLADPTSYFTETADPMTVLSFPWAMDMTRREAGELYEVRLIYASNPSEQIRELYRDALEPISEHWYLLTVYYVRSTVPGVWTMPDRYGYGMSYLELNSNGTARLIETTYDSHADEQFRFDADPGEPYGMQFSKSTLLIRAVYDPETDVLTVRFSDGSERTATRAAEIVLPRQEPDDRSARSALKLPVSCPVSALDPAFGEHAEKGQLFFYDIDGDGRWDPISFYTDADGYPVIRIGETETEPLMEMGKGAILREAILLNPHETTGDLTLALEVKDRQIDCSNVDVLRIQNGKKTAHTYYPNCSMRLVDGEVFFTEWCYVLGSISGTSLRQGALLRRVPPGWVETGVLDRVQNKTREEQIAFHDLIEVVRDLPCTIKDAPAVIEAGTWVYVLRWNGTRIVIRTEDGREATLEVQTERSDDGLYVARYLIDGVDAEDYFDNLDMAG